MRKAQKARMNEFFEEMETIEGMEKTYTDAVDYPDEVPLIEELLVEEEEDYTEDEINAFLENINLESSNNPLSFDEMMPKPVQETGISYQRKENVVTPHYLVLREYVKQAPSVCTYRDCFYDGARAIGFKNWEKTPEKRKKIALAALEQHNQKKHRFDDTDIIDEANIPKFWMSPST